MKIRLTNFPEEFVDKTNNRIRKIYLIKKIREVTGWGLKESKGVADSMIDYCSPMVEVTYRQYRDFMDSGFSADEVTKTRADMIEDCIRIQKSFIMNGRLEAAKRMVDVLGDLMNHDK